MLERLVRATHSVFPHCSAFVVRRDGDDLGVLAPRGGRRLRGNSWVRAALVPGPPRVLGPEPAGRLGELLGLSRISHSALVSPLRADRAELEFLLLLDARDGAFHDSARAAAEALGTAAAAMLDRLQLDTVLSSVCDDAARALGADHAAVCLGDRHGGVTIEAVIGLPGDHVGELIEPGQGLIGQVVRTGRAAYSNERSFGRSELAVPIRTGGALSGVLMVGYERPFEIGRRHLVLAEAVARPAGDACREAAAYASLALRARIDPLTGCLNHATFFATLQRELDRCTRTGHLAALALIELDGRLAGDELLRPVGRALRETVRAYDLVGRVGADRFAVVALETGEREAIELTGRAAARVAEAFADLGRAGADGGTSAGVAEWQPGEDASALLGRADRALLRARHEPGRGRIVAASGLEDSARPSPPFPPGPAKRKVATGPAERLRRRTRQLTLANALGARLAEMTDTEAIVEATVEELHRAFDFHLCAVVRIREDDSVEAVAVRGEQFLRLGDPHWSQPRSAGLIGRCLRTRRPVLSGDTQAEPEPATTHATEEGRSELVVPVWVGGGLWGAINIEELEHNAFDADDVRLVETVADQVGSALRSAGLYERLERAYLDTAQALATALEEKDAYTASHSEQIVDSALRVGLELGLEGEELRDLRFAAVFHDIGKIAVPEAILHKPGPLTPDELREIQRHPVVGERILGSIEFLNGVRPLVRHEHEHWDGSGYPDGLAGEAIPLGSRIILACDAYDAMTTNRPYRAAMKPRVAQAELRRCAGSQFDPDVVDTLLGVLSAA